MLKAYLEPNIINWAARSSWSGDDLRRSLNAQGLEPHFGIHGIYELARGFLAEHSADAAQRNFLVLSELEPVFEPTPEMFFEKEIDRLRTGAIVVPVLDELNRVSAKQQVAQMAAGQLEQAGREFIHRRESNVDRDHPGYTAHQLLQVRRAVAAGRPRPKTFEAVLAEFNDKVPSLIRQLLSNKVTASEALELHARLDEFPALRAAIRANLYLWAIPLMHEAGASRDKNDDYRHVIEASYCHVLVTGDEQLERTTPRLNPELGTMAWRDLKTG